MPRSLFFALLVVAGADAAPATEGILPVSPRDSLNLIRTKPGLEVELVACEPVIVDPVAIDWGADGKLWVCEMHDYPTGLDGNFQPGGRIKTLEDADGDGFYEKATLFAESLAFPTGVTAWGKGAFICAAPDLIYAEDTNGDGKADRIEKVFAGFATDNYQARLNSLAIGLDNWVYGANGLLGGVIRGVSKGGVEVNIRNHDFRFNPFTRAFEGVSGVTQYGRARDDWGNWFGCNNSEQLLHFPWNERYAMRNPAVSLPAANLFLPTGDTRQVFPTSKLQERYNDLDNANRFTSAGGLGIYRDTLLGEEFYGNAFTCEAVHNLVHRQVISGDGVNFTGKRASDEQKSEFFSSSDNWFRPAQVRTGPDGALYIVDIYRFLIEHPRWIAAKRLAEIDVRAGADKGRIYRVKPYGKKLREIRNLRALSAGELAAAIDSPNGTERDRAHVELLTRRDKAAVSGLLEVAQKSKLPQARLQALSVAEGLGGVKEEDVMVALRDGDAQVRVNALRLSETFLAQKSSEQLVTAVVSQTNYSARTVVHQLAYTLGEWNDDRAGEVLAFIASAHPADRELRMKILISSRSHAGLLLTKLSGGEWRAPLLATLAMFGDRDRLERAVEGATNWDESAVLLEGGAKRGIDLTQKGAKAIDAAREVAFARDTPEAKRLVALNLVSNSARDSDVKSAVTLVTESNSKKIREAASEILRQKRDLRIARELLTAWSKASPVVRGEVLSILLERAEWMSELMTAVSKGTVQRDEISPSDRQRLLQSNDDRIRSEAREFFQHRGSREEVLKKYAEVKNLKGEAKAGGVVFSRACASCHALNGTGAPVGPDLAALRGKDVEYLVQNVLDPNAIVEPRFVAYNVELKDDRELLGIIKTENASALTLMMGGGQMEEVARSGIKEIRAASFSLMPEGLEQAISTQEMADLVAYLKDGTQETKAASAGAEVVLRDPVSVARFVLADSQPLNLRENAIKANPQFAADLIAEMSRGLSEGKEEYRRIPWIWRVSIAAAKRNDAEQLRRILGVSLPEGNEPLRDWQAVVIGGGVINGISQRGIWPRERITEIIGSDDDLNKRWTRALDLASTMADNEDVAEGTRYDALRMLGVEPWEKRGAQMVRYLENKKGELQMGGVSGLGDMNSPEAAKALRDALPNLTEGNRRVAEEALQRFEK